jgi:hypothetical protein
MSSPRILVVVAVLAITSVSAPALAGPPAVRRPATRGEGRAAAAFDRALRPIVRRAALRANLEHTRSALGVAESRSTGEPARWRRDPLIYRLVAAVRGARAGRTERTLADVVTRLERVVGPIALPEGLPAGRALGYRAERAASLASLGRRASEVGAYYVQAGATTVRPAGRPAVAVAARGIHVEVWRALGPLRGVVRVAPGYQEAAPQFHVLADALNRAGVEVHIMEQQWAGESTGAVGAGQLDSPEGVARDSAAVDGHLEVAAAVRGLPFAVVGSSMGGGPGSLLEQALVRDGAFAGMTATVAGRAIAPPRGAPPIVALAPYVAATPSLTNRFLAAVGRVPFVRELPLPMLPLPRFVSSSAREATVAGGAARGGVSGRAAAIVRGALDPAERAAIGRLPNAIIVVQGVDDVLADSDAVRATVRAARAVSIGDERRYDHIQQHTPASIEAIVDQVRVALAAAR